MKISSTTPANVNIFKQAIIKSLNENTQLVFSRKLTISCNHENFPAIEISDIRDIIDIPNTENQLTGIICFFDNRTNFLNFLKLCDKCSLSIYFPLSREKYIMFSKVRLLNENNEKDLEYLNKYWSSLNEEEKLQYETVDKDSIKPNLNITEDLIRYTAQEKDKFSVNFSVAEFIPFEVEFTIFPMPQVIANLRRQKFESLLKPHKMPQKFLMKYIEENDKKEWISHQLN